MIIAMKMKELLMNYLTADNLDLVKKSTFIPISHTLQSNGSMSNVISGSNLLPLIEVCLESNINNENEYVSVKDGMNTLCHYFDKNPRGRVFMARMVKYSMKHPNKILVLLFDDDECDNFNYLNFFREYFYCVFNYPCIICIKGLQYKERDKVLLEKVLLNPDKEFINEIKETIKDIQYEYHLFRQQIWKDSVKKRIRDFSTMSKKELYDECRYVIYNMDKKDSYSKEELVSMLSEYYGTGVSDQEAYESSLFKAIKGK